jgi:hypothetical protein
MRRDAVSDVHLLHSVEGEGDLGSMWTVLFSLYRKTLRVINQHIYIVALVVIWF